MARLPRLSVAEVPHLLLQRGHAGQAVFRDEIDRQLFTELLGEASRLEKVSIHAYALRDDEIRLLATPTTATGLSRLMQTLGRRYGTAFNRRHGRRGSLWEGRFRATVIEPERCLLPATVFVEGPPVMTPWVVPGGDTTGRGSSLLHHLGSTQDPLVTDHPVFWALGNTPFERDLAYRRKFEQGLSLAETHELTSAVEKGWPLGSAEFLAALAGKTGRRLVPLKRGRPRKLPISVPN